MRNLIGTILFTLLYLQCFAQTNKLYLGASFELPFGIYSRVDNLRQSSIVSTLPLPYIGYAYNESGSKQTVMPYGIGLRLRYILKNRFGISLISKYGMTAYLLKVKKPYYYEPSQLDVDGWLNTFHNLTNSIELSYAIPLKSSSSKSLVFGLSYELITTIKIDGKKEPYNHNYINNAGTGIATSQLYYKRKPSSNIGFEIAHRKRLKNNHLFEVGLHFSLGFSDYSTQLFKYYENNILRSENEVGVRGESIALNFKFDFNLVKKKKEKIVTPKIKKVNVKNEICGNKRTINYLPDIVSYNQNITISFSDFGQPDGDKISVCLNGIWLFKNIELSKDPITVSVKLNEGENIISIYANNLGDVGQNTVGVRIHDGIRDIEMNLKCDKKQSDALRILYR